MTFSKLTKSSICLANKYAIWNTYDTKKEAQAVLYGSINLDPSYEIMTIGEFLEIERT